jgi:UDP-N-acetyl-D-mannosaminuronate dehydrogenase
MPDRLVNQAEEALGGLTGLRAVVLGASYRGGVKETAFSGVFPTVDALERRGAVVQVHDPFYTDDELRALGFTPFALGSDTDLAILHTDHAAYRELGAAHFPGIRLLVDGRATTDPARWAGVPRLVVGTVGTE